MTRRSDRSEPDAGTWICSTDDVPHAAAVLARAFAEDPVLSWMFSDDHRRDAHLLDAFDTWLRRIHVPKGAVEHDERGGVACWSPPERWRLSMTQQLRLLPSMAGVFGVARLPRVLAGLQLLADRHPDDEPHWYLAFLGVEPTMQGTGVGTALLSRRLARCDQAGEASYLEASHPDNVAFYERLGFEPLETFDLPDGPPVTTMWRRPRWVPLTNG